MPVAVKTRAVYRCGACGHQPAKWVGRCPECGEWGTVDEAAPASTSRSRGAVGVAPSSPAKRLTEIGSDAAKVIPTGIGEFDRVLGRGVVPGSVILLAGEPGVGKSTLLLEAAKHWARAGRRVLYVTGEESAGQVGCAPSAPMPSTRTSTWPPNPTWRRCSARHRRDPTLLIVDSVQTMIATDADGVHGGVTQIRAVTTALVSLAKNTGVAVVLVGHVTKDGAVAGPAVVGAPRRRGAQLRGDKHSRCGWCAASRTVSAPPTVGCFEQRDNGIHQVTDRRGSSGTSARAT